MALLDRWDGGAAKATAAAALALELAPLFGQLDADGDGALSQAEYRAFLEGIQLWGRGNYVEEGWDARWPEECQILGADPAMGVTAEGFVVLYSEHRVGKATADAESVAQAPARAAKVAASAAALEALLARLRPAMAGLGAAHEALEHEDDATTDRPDVEEKKAALTAALGRDDTPSPEEVRAGMPLLLLLLLLVVRRCCCCPADVVFCCRGTNRDPVARRTASCSRSTSRRRTATRRAACSCWPGRPLWIRTPQTNRAT